MKNSCCGFLTPEVEHQTGMGTKNEKKTLKHKSYIKSFLYKNVECIKYYNNAENVVNNDSVNDTQVWKSRSRSYLLAALSIMTSEEHPFKMTT